MFRDLEIGFKALLLFKNISRCVSPPKAMYYWRVRHVCQHFWRHRVTWVLSTLRGHCHLVLSWDNVTHHVYAISYPKHDNQTRHLNFIPGLFIILIPHTKREHSCSFIYCSFRSTCVVVFLCCRVNSCASYHKAFYGAVPLNLFVQFCRKTEEQKPKEQRPKASENKPVMNE